MSADTKPQAPARPRRYVAIRPYDGGTRMHLDTCPAVRQARPDRVYPQDGWDGLTRDAIIRKRAARLRRNGLPVNLAKLTADLHSCIT